MAFTPIFWDGFEDGTSKRWSNFAGYITAITVKHGNYAGYLSTLESCRIIIDPSQTDIYISCWFQPQILANNVKIFRAYDSGNNPIVTAIAEDATGLVKLYNHASSSWASSATALSAGAWYHVEGHISLAVGGAAQVKVDNSLVIDESPDLSSFASIDSILFGAHAALDTYGVGDLYLDNVVIGTGGWPGDLQIWRGTVDADGTTNEWTPSTGTDNYACVDEVPVVSTDYVATNVVDQIDLYTAPDMGFGLDTVYGVAVVTNNQTEGAPTPANASHVIRTGGTNYLGASQTVPADASLMTIWTTNPGTSAAWTQTEIQDSEIGIKSLA